jgi:predicted RNase H-like HicB family nuclease
MAEPIAATNDAGTLTYTAAFRFEEGWWWAQAVEVPEAFGQGRTIEEARESLVQGISAALDARLEDGEPVPPSGQVTVGPVTVVRG